MNKLRQIYNEMPSFASSVNCVTASQLLQLQRGLAMSSPGLFALIASQGKWKLAKHLVELDNALVDAIEAARAGEIVGLTVSMPPQHGKSELCSKYLPAWYLGAYPDHKVVVVGYEADFAAGWGRKARDLLEEHGHLFGVQVAKQSRAATRWEIDGHDGGMVTAGVGGPITGKGAHLLIIDDPIKNDEEARSSSFREKLWEWWQSVASTRIRPGGLFVIIQTRWHRDDLTGRLLRHDAKSGRWRQIVFPALATSNDILGRQPGEALWPQMYPREKLLQVQQDKTAYYWRALYQQDPQAEGGTEWPESYFKPEIWFNEWPTDECLRVVALDPSKGKESKFGDYSAFVKVMWNDGVLYVDAEMERWNTAEIVERAVQIQRTFKPHNFGIEVNQFQSLLAEQIDIACRARTIDLPLLTIENRQNKVVRIRTLTPFLAREHSFQR